MLTTEMLRSVRPLRRLIKRARKKIAEVSWRIVQEGNSPELQAILEERKKAEEQAVIDYERHLSKVEQEIRQISDPYIQEILLYRYSDNFSWGQISARCGGQSPSSCRMMVKRWIDKNLE